jgi:HlyD family secretion protein
MNKIYLLLLLQLIFACSDGDEKTLYFDGRLETDIVKVSAKTSGTLDSIFVDEGDAVKQGQLLAVIETDRLQLQKEQQTAQNGEISSNILSLEAQSRQLKSQLKLNEDLINKTKDLVQKGASTSQKLDELTTQNDILKAQLQALSAQKSALYNKREQLLAGIALTNLNIKDSHLTAAENGIILNRYFNNSELVNPGMPVFELADLSVMDVTIYVPLNRLTSIKLNQNVQVEVDGVEEPFEGSVKWIASEAEFTPKTILTEETRTSLVYAVKIRVINSEGKLKIGMPVQVLINMES